MDLIFRGTKLSWFSWFDSHPWKFSPAKIWTSAYWAANDVHFDEQWRHNSTKWLPWFRVQWTPVWRSVESPLWADTRDSPRHMTDRCARFLDRNCKGIFSIASFATAAENLSNTRLPHCPINMKSTNATLDFKHPLSDLRNDNFRSSP